jgi:hypothetical protein
MNWIERRAEKESILNTGRENAWGNLALIICDSVRSFRASYPYSPIDARCSSSLGKVLVERFVRVEGGASRRISLSITLDANTDAIRFHSIDGDTFAAVNGSIALDVKDGSVVMVTKDMQELSMDAASQLILEKFLFG